MGPLLSKSPLVPALLGGRVMGKQEGFSSDESAPHTWYLHLRGRALFYSQTAPVMKGWEGTETWGRRQCRVPWPPRLKSFSPMPCCPGLSGGAGVGGQAPRGKGKKSVWTNSRAELQLSKDSGTERDLSAKVIHLTYDRRVCSCHSARPFRSQSAGVTTHFTD